MSSSHEAASSQDFLAEEVRRYHHFIVLALWLAVVTGAEIVLIYLPLPTAVIFTAVYLVEYLGPYGIWGSGLPAVAK